MNPLTSWTSRIDTLIRQLQGFCGRRLRGSVDSSGAALSGYGFSSSKTGTGAYTVEFTESFASGPYIFIQTVTSGGVRTATIAAADADGFSIEIRNDGGSLADSAFYFEAIV